jgi:hypothetical protein
MLANRRPNAREKSDAPSAWTFYLPQVHMFLSLFTCRTSHHFPMTVPHDLLPCRRFPAERTSRTAPRELPMCRLHHAAGPRAPRKGGRAPLAGRPAACRAVGAGTGRRSTTAWDPGEPCASSVRSPLRRGAMPPVLPARKGGRAPLASQPTACRVAGAGAGRHSTAAWLGELRAPTDLATFSTKSMAGSYLVGCATRPRWSGGAFRRQLGRTQGQWSSGFGCFGFFFMLQSFYIGVATIFLSCCN